LRPPRPADFTAEVTLLPTEAGGRQGPLVQGEWRAVLGVDDVNWSALMMFDGAPGPGETFDVEIWLLLPSEALVMFPAETEFTVWDGGTKGLGRVL